MVIYSLIFMMNSIIILLSGFRHECEMREYHSNILHTLKVFKYYLLKKCQKS